MWHKILLILLLSQSITLIAEETITSENITYKLLNSGSNYLAALKTASIINPEGTAWAAENTQVILMGNVLDAEQDLAIQIAQINTLQSLASANNGKLSVLMGNTEYELSNKTKLSEEVTNWLSALPATIKVGEDLVSHRGLSLKELTVNKAQLDVMVHHPANYLGSQICHPLFEADRLRQGLAKKSAARLWVTQAQDFKAPWQKRLSDQLHILNNGVMATIIDGRAIVSNADGTDVLFAEKSPARYPENPVGMSEAEILDILRNGEVIGEEAIPVGITKPMKLTLSYKGKQIDAAFKNFDDAPNNQRGRWKVHKRYADRYHHELAAYKLDRKLNLGLVPASIERKIDKDKGSLQVWYDGLISKLSYRKDDGKYEGQCDRKAQRNMMRVFDYLILNDDRNQSNILYNKDDWQVWFIDHSRAFTDDAKRPDQMRKADDMYITPEFRSELEALDKQQLQTLRPWLHKKRITALDKRRKYLLSGRANRM